MLLGMLGELVQTTDGKWITHPPTRCPNGHPVGPNQVLVGHQACLGHGGGHTTWTRRTCDETVYGPQLNTHFLKAPLRLNFAWSPLPSFSLRSPTINPTVRMNDGFNYARPGV
jgi:hypothetical protein